MLTYPRFAKACYAFFAVAVVTAILKLSVSSAEPALLRMLPAAPAASVAEPAKESSKGLGDSRLGSFSDDGGAERLEAVFSHAASRNGVSRTAPREDGLEGTGDESDGPSGDASVFRRPSLDAGSPSGPVCGDIGDAPRSSRVVFPLPKEYFDSYEDTWGAARPQGGHEGSDLMSPAGTPEFALTDGKLVGVAGSNENGWNRLGGYTVMLEAAYDIGPIKKGGLFYYAHLNRESSLPIGTTVRAGQKIGTVGDTGEGPEVTRGKFPPHLHLGWYDADLSRERSEAESGAMNPYPLLLWVERNGGAVSGGTDASYCQAPSTGEPDWPTASAPGERPDLDTGDSPSPAAREGHRHNHPKRDRDDGEKNRGEETVGNEGNGAAEAEKPRDEAKQATKFSLRKKLKAGVETHLHDLPAGEFDRNVPKDRDDEGISDDKREDRKDGGQNGKVRGEEPQKTDRPDEDRAKDRQDAPPDNAPNPPAPIAAPDPQPRPIPEKHGDEKPEAAEEEPRAETPPVPASPSEKPAPVPDAGGTTGETVLPVEETVPAPDAVVVDDSGGKAAEERPETGEGE